MLGHPGDEAVGTGSGAAIPGTSGNDVEITINAMEPIDWTEINDTDSGYNEEQMSTASVTSSIFAYQEENGRTYHAYRAGKYVMPNDEGEQERMDLHYHALRLTLEKKHWIAPIEDPRSIIDVGTGTGIWAMDVADDFPGATVLGIDLSPIQPLLVPPNLEFFIQDLEEPWDMPNRFDLVHTRLMNGFSVKSWPNFYKNAFESMKPGGWVENQEFDLDFTTDDKTQPPDSAVRRWQDIWNAAVATAGMTGRCDARKMAEQMTDAGFVNVVVEPYKMPVGPWPRNKTLQEAGVYNLIGMTDGLTGLSLRVFTQILGWTVNEMEALLLQVRAEWRRKGIHCYLPIYVVYGQKPPARYLMVLPRNAFKGKVANADGQSEAMGWLEAPGTPGSLDLAHARLISVVPKLATYGLLKRSAVLNKKAIMASAGQLAQ